jgi:hypothetical protein
MPPYGDPAMPIDIPSAALVDPPFTPSNMALAHIPGFSPLSSSPSSSSYSSSSSSLASSWDGSPPWTLWSRVHSGVPSAMGQGYYTNVLDQESSNYHSSGFPPDGLCAFSGSLATSPGLDTRASTGGTNVSQRQYSAIHTGRLVDRPVLKRQKTADQMGVQGTYDRRVTCTVNNCGKSFSGEWEKMRHIKSLHHPPTIGCRDCNYKQSRKDLFSEHCRKRHPGESVEELMVQLVDANGTRS